MTKPLLAFAVVFTTLTANAAPAADVPPPAPLEWPAVTPTMRPWCYWWWMGSAVDKPNLTRELEAYHDAGVGGVHIIPIYGAKGYERDFIKYLSPDWMDMLRHVGNETRRLDMGYDMTTGTGWCFGGPNVADREAVRSRRQRLTTWKPARNSRTRSAAASYRRLSPTPTMAT